MIRMARHLAVLTVASLPLASCAAYQMPPLTTAHPAHPDAPVPREGAASQTLAYTQADVEAVRAPAQPTAPAHADGQAAGASAKTVVGEGEVVATTPASGQIVVEHGAIEGFMDAMTMGYRIDPPSLLATVQPGDKIRFTIDVDRRTIVHIEKVR